ncbi:MAG: homocysteine S-methyltransferase family protein [Syntrophales bacterium]
MQPNRRITALVREKILILDGAMGTELHKRGLPPGACPEAWCLANPAAVAEIHASYRAAGADIVYSATFGANRVKLGLYGRTDVRETNRGLAAIAKRAVGPQGLVAGDIGPTGRFVVPFGDLPFDEAVALFREQAEGLLEGGVDCFVIETMMDIQEARAALIAVRELTDRFTIVTMTYEGHGRTLNGTDPVTALVTLQGLGADAVGCNCSLGPEAMLGMIAALKPHARVPLVAKPNAGLPHLVGEETVFDADAAAFSAFGGRFAAAGVNLIGGCCGTTPDHIGALRATLAAERPIAPVSGAGAAVSSARGAQILNRGEGLVFVGGRLNPAEDETLRQALSAGEAGPIRQAFREQEKEGAAIIRLRAGVPGLDEPEILGKLLEQLSATSRTPLMIDCEGLDTGETVLRRYPGCPLLAAGGQEAWAQVFSAARRYGAVPVLRCAPEEGPTVGRATIRALIAEARRYGFTREGIVVDITAPGPIPEAKTVRTALEMIRWCSDHAGCRTLLDLTGIGRGLPEPQWLQAALLATAQAAGLTLAVVDPALRELTNIRAAGDLLAGRDPDAAAWRSRFT